MGFLHSLHLPLKASQLTKGIFSYQCISWLHFGQCEGAVTMDSPRGIRQMQTLRKLPMQHPKINTKKYHNGISSEEKG
jgi:hypothetical protein